MSLLILVCVLDFLFVTTSEIVIYTEKYGRRTSGIISSTIVMRISAMIILSKLIIKNTKMYKHHCLSIKIILVVVIIIIIINKFLYKKINFLIMVVLVR